MGGSGPLPGNQTRARPGDVEDVGMLAREGGYVAGVGEELRARTDLYDLLVDVSARSVAPSPLAAEVLARCLPAPEGSDPACHWRR